MQLGEEAMRGANITQWLPYIIETVFIGMHEILQLSRLKSNHNDQQLQYHQS